MSEIASLSIEIDSSSAIVAKKNQDALTASGKNLETQVNALTTSQMKSHIESQKVAEAWRRQEKGVQAASAEVQKILHKYDPLGTKLRQLQTDFANLDKAIASGAVGGTSDKALDKTMRSLNAEISKTKGLMLAAGEGTASASLSMAGLGLNTQMTRRHLMMLGREAVTGHFSQMPQTLMSIVMHSRLLAVLMSPLALAVGAVAAVTGVWVAALSLGNGAINKMNTALATTNNFAGLTRSGMLSLSESMARTGQVTVGVAEDIVTALVSSGRIGAGAIGSVAQLAAKFARATGEDIDKITPKLISMFSDPAKGAEELNKSMHFLSLAELQRIHILQQAGRETEASTEFARLLTLELDKQPASLWTIGKALKSAATDWSSFWKAARGLVTGEESFETKIDRVRAQIASASPQNKGRFEAEERRLMTEYGKKASAATTAGLLAEQNAADQTALSYARGNSALAKKLDLQAKLVLLQKSWDRQEAGSTEANILFDAIKKTKEDIKNVGKDKASQTYAQLVKSSEEYAKALSNETEKLGLNAIQQKMVAASQAALKAPTAELRMEIMKKAQAWAISAQAAQGETDAMKFQEKAIQELTKKEKQLEEERKQASKVLEDELATLIRENETFGLGRAGLEKYTLAKLEARLASLDSAAASWEVAALEKQIELQRQIVGAAEKNDQLQANKKLEKETNDFARKAAENIQDMFADFLFDPFDKGIKGMLDSFSNMVRRMVAEAAAADLAKRLLGGAGGIEGLVKLGVNLAGNFFGFGQTQSPAPVSEILIPRASGGPVSAGTPYLVGEKGPETFIPARSGTIVPNGGTGNVITINFAISGAVDSRTQMQIAQQAGTAVQRAMRRNG